MVNITSRGRYGVKAMFELALRHGQGPVPLRLVAERQRLPEHYLEQLMGPLRKAGLVRSVRGAQGGYLLGREPQDLTVGEILRVLEGPATPDGAGSGVEGDVIADGADDEDYTIRTIWQRMTEAVNQVVDSITLADLCEQEHERRLQQNFTYYI